MNILKRRGIEMTYKYITIQAIPAPLDAVLDDGSEYTRGVARETALAKSAPALAERVAHLEWCLEAIRKADEAAK
jgi:PHD/YefM family antitoxin component YafN of YafNO toxin-antitoxin module